MTRAGALRSAARRRAPGRTAPLALRWHALDIARGLAIVAMIVYHFCFDAAWNGWLAADFGADWRWLTFRIAILGSFLFIAGMSLALAVARGQTTIAYWKRIVVIATAAALVTIGSFVMFPDSFIYFGVLHAIALMSVLGRPLIRLLLRVPLALLVLGVAIVIAGNAIQSPLFDRPALHWIGMMTFRPRTEDYVPLFPWFGVFLAGAWLGLTIAARHGLSIRIAEWQRPRSTAWIEWLGRHSLAVYLLHQPLLLGAMLAIRHVA